jgi:GH15 family glucan-1,4-alpha-glucosidase
MAYKPISDYGVISNMHSAALVGLDGSIDWLCFPRFDSPSVFAALLDDARGGRFQIAPVASAQVEQRYLPDTNILCTRFHTDAGDVELVDCMPLKEDATESDHEVIRVVRGLRGSVPMALRLQPRLDYARGHPGRAHDHRGARRGPVHRARR